MLFVQISDLHIAGMIGWFGAYTNWREGRPERREPDRWPHSHGHDEYVATDLTSELMHLEKYAPGFPILVTGDLTQKGGGSEFGLAHRFLHAYWNPKPFEEKTVGLGAGEDRVLTIPGNHDVWNGKILNPVVHRDVLKAHFWELPWAHVLSDYAEGVELHLVGLDSCSGLFDLSLAQVATAQGAVDQAHLGRAGALFGRLWARRGGDAGAAGRQILRAVLVHHPPDCMTRSSRRTFLEWLETQQVSAILTGHTHEHRCDDRPITGGFPCYEFRCGTTLQAGTWGKLPGMESNHFYVHRIERNRTTNELTWIVSQYWHDAVGWISNPERDQTRVFP
jgi:Calcineurin-like phosphoesterase